MTHSDTILRMLQKFKGLFTKSPYFFSERRALLPGGRNTYNMVLCFGPFDGILFPFRHDPRAPGADFGTQGEQSMIAFLILGALLVCALLFVLIRGRLRLRGAAFALALAAATAAVALAGIGVKQGLVFCRYASAPEETVEAFFDDLEAARYDEACALLGNYADLGLSGRPEDPAAAELCDALRASYSGRLVGKADTEGLAAVQRVEFTALDVSALQSELRGVVLERLAEIVDSRSYDEVYDEQDQYRPEIAEEAADSRPYGEKRRSQRKKPNRSPASAGSIWRGRRRERMRSFRQARRDVRKRSGASFF